jgi:hypothetical protein
LVRKQKELLAVERGIPLEEIEEETCMEKLNTKMNTYFKDI